MLALKPTSRLNSLKTAGLAAALCAVLNAQATTLSPLIPADGTQAAAPWRVVGFPKASANIPWEGDDHIAEGDPRGWETVSPSPIAFGGGLSKVPREMTLADIEKVKADYVAAAIRARPRCCSRSPSASSAATIPPLSTPRWRQPKRSST